MPIRIADFDVQTLGIDEPSYFPGVSTAYTPFIHKAVGMGTNALEALDDAIEMAAQWVDDVSPLEGVAAFDGITMETDALTEREIENGLQCYVAILFNVEEA
jgi:hypothetical protein